MNLTIVKTLAFSLAAAIGLLFFDGCAKGDGDPFISPYPRKMRLVGDWTCSDYRQIIETKYEYEYQTGESYSADLYEFTEIFGEDLIVEHSDKYSYNDTITSNIYSYGQGDAELKITFNKDYTFSRELTMSDVEHTRYDNYNPSIPTENYTSDYEEIIEGTWSFAGADADFKNKERVILEVTSWKETSETKFADRSEESILEEELSSGVWTEVWRLETLDNKYITMSLVSSTKADSEYEDSNPLNQYYYSEDGENDTRDSISVSWTQE